MKKGYVIFAFLGLLFASLIISQTIISNATYKYNFYSEYLSSNNNSLLQFKNPDVYLRSNYEGLINSEPVLNSVIKQNNFNVTEIINNVWINIPIQVNQTSIFNLKIQLINQAVFDELKQFKSFPLERKYGNNSSFVTGSFYDSNFNSYISNSTSLNFVSQNQTLNFGYSKIWIPSIADIEFYEKDPFLFQHISNLEGTLFVNDTVFTQLYTRILQIQTPSLNFQIFFLNNYLDLVNTNINQLKDELIRLKTNVTNWFDLYKINLPILDSPLLETIQNYQSSSTFIPAFILIATGPMIGLSIFLIYFSLTLLEDRTKRLITIMKMRGNSKEQLNIILLSEVITSAFISIFIGMILSIPWTSLILRSSGLLKFNLPQIPLIIPYSWYWELPLISLIISIDVNLGNIFSLTSVSLDEGFKPDKVEEPLWQFYHFDIILFSIALVYLLFIRYIPINDNFLYINLLDYFGPIMLIILSITTPLVISRYYLDLVDYFSRLLYKTKHDFLLLVTRNMKQNKFMTSKLLALLIIGITLTLTILIVPQTYFNWNTQNMYYQNGSDIFVTGVSPHNTNLWNKMQITGVSSYSEIFKADYHQSSLMGQSIDYVILGVNPKNFEKSAYWNNNYGNLNNILISIKQNNSIAIQSSKAVQFNLKIDNKLIVKTPDTFLNLKINSFFTYFPQLSNSIVTKGNSGLDNSNVLDILANYNLLYNISLSHSFNYEEGAYIKVRQGYNITNISTELRKIYSNYSNITVTDINDFGNNFGSLVLNQVLISTLQGMFVLSLIITFLGVIYYDFIMTNGRKKEISLLRVFGMERKQILHLLVLELGLVLIVSMFIGTILGLIISSNFLYIVIHILNLYNPSSPIYFSNSWILILTILILFISISLILTLISAKLQSNQKNWNVLRSEIE